MHTEKGEAKSKTAKGMRGRFGKPRGEHVTESTELAMKKKKRRHKKERREEEEREED